MPRIRLAIESLSGCEGCEMALLEIGMKLVDLIEAGSIEIVHAPLIMDSEELERADVALVSGSVRNEEDEEKAKWIRERVDVLVAFGTCAYAGGIHGLGNVIRRDDLLRAVYGREPTREVPPVIEYTKRLWRVVKVDTFIPGCPPPPDLIAKVLTGILEGEMPAYEWRTVCDECPLRREEKKAKRVVRLVERPKDFDPERCLLEQGYLCLGPVTLAGCGALCPRKLVPCIGCLGFMKTPEEDFDTAIARALASIGASFDVEPPERMAEEVGDVVGTFMKFMLPSFSIPGLIRRGEHVE